MLQLRAARRGAIVASRALQVARRGAASSSTSVAHKEPSDPQLGDYPDLPIEFAQNRNPFGNSDGRWWDVQNRRNFGEPVRALCEETVGRC